MNNQIENILVFFGIFMVLKHIFVSVMVDQKTVIYQHNVAIMMMAFLKKNWEQREGDVKI